MVIWEQYAGSADGWDGIVGALSGGFYQSHGWGEVKRSAGWRPLRLVAHQGGVPLAAANVLVKHKLGIAVCWIPGGPVGAPGWFDSSFLRALSQAASTPALYCRLSLLRSGSEEDADLLARQGWVRPSAPMSSGMTMNYSLSGDEQDRLKRTSGNWRHNLKRSLRYGLRVEHWDDPDSAQISALYREMERLKSLPVQHTAEELGTLVRTCREKLVVYRCLDAQGRLLAIRAAGICGTSAMDLLAAAGEEARKVYASHATLWALLDHCSRSGLETYDLSGVDPVGNKGVYDFKHGTGAELVHCLGEWEWTSVPGLRQLVNWQIARQTATN